MVEDVRKSAIGTVEEPPSLRAWGSIIVKASKNGFIKRVGYKQVNNPLAHKTPASLWAIV
jgi:hypothetical protein